MKYQIWQSDECLFTGNIYLAVVFLCNYFGWNLELNLDHLINQLRQIKINNSAVHIDLALTIYNLG